MEQFVQLSVLLVVIQLMSRASCINMPSKMPQGMYCEGCIATVTEIAKRVNKPSLDSREVRVVEAFENICHYSNFDTYAYSPPKTAKACDYLMEHFDEEMEETILKSQDAKDCEEKICYKLTQACEGIDRDSEEHKKTMHQIEMEPPEDGIPFGRDPDEADPADYAGDDDEPEEDENADDAEKEEDPEEDPEEGKKDDGKDGKGKEEEDDMVYYPPEPLKGELPDNVTPAGDFPGAKPVPKSEL